MSLEIPSGIPRFLQYFFQDSIDKFSWVSVGGYFTQFEFTLNITHKIGVRCWLLDYMMFNFHLSSVRGACRLYEDANYFKYSSGDSFKYSFPDSYHGSKTSRWFLFGIPARIPSPELPIGIHPGIAPIILSLIPPWFSIKSLIFFKKYYWFSITQRNINSSSVIFSNIFFKIPSGIPSEFIYPRFSFLPKRNARFFYFFMDLFRDYSTNSYIFSWGVFQNYFRIYSMISSLILLRTTFGSLPISFRDSLKNRSEIISRFLPGIPLGFLRRFPPGFRDSLDSLKNSFSDSPKNFSPTFFQVFLTGFFPGIFHRYRRWNRW